MRGKLPNFLNFREEREITYTAGVGLPGTGCWRWASRYGCLMCPGQQFSAPAGCPEVRPEGSVRFPVYSGQDVVAVLEFFATRCHEPNDSLLELMSQIGLLLGRVIERQRAEDALRIGRFELTRARDEPKRPTGRNPISLPI